MGSHSTLIPTGAGLKPEGACLDMGELQQVLLDEELARRLQEEEERLLRGVRGNTATSLLYYAPSGLSPGGWKAQCQVNLLKLFI